MIGAPSVIKTASDLDFGAEDGIRTRDPHLGKKKVAVFVHPAPVGAL